VLTGHADIATYFGYNRTAVQYSTTSWWAITSYLARILTTQWGGVRTTMTLMYKREPGVAPERLTTNQANILQGKNCNVGRGQTGVRPRSGPGSDPPPDPRQTPVQ